MSAEYRDGYDMIRALFEGYSSSDVAEFFVDHGYWHPEMTYGAASARVRSCWSPDGDQYFKVSELIAWSRHAGRRALVDYACDEIGLPRPGEPGASSEALRGLFRELREQELVVETIRSEIEAQIEREQGQPPDNVTHLGTPESVHRPRFCRFDSVRIQR